MKKFTTLLLTLTILTACSGSSGAFSSIPLYPVATWNPVKTATRTFDFGDGKKVEIEGSFISGFYDDQTTADPVNESAQTPHEDFWLYYGETYGLKELGYKDIFMEENLENRSMVGFRDKHGHLVILSHVTEPKGGTAEEPDCPCFYRYSIFTNDERIELTKSEKL